MIIAVVKIFIKWNFWSLKQLSFNTHKKESSSKYNSTSVMFNLQDCEYSTSKYCPKLAKMIILMVKIFVQLYLQCFKASFFHRFPFLKNIKKSILHL